MNAKKIWKSKMFWHAVLIFIFGGAQAINPIVPSEYTGMLLLANAALEGALRYITKSEVSF